MKPYKEVLAELREMCLYIYASDKIDYEVVFCGNGVNGGNASVVADRICEILDIKFSAKEIDEKTEEMKKFYNG